MWRQPLLYFVQPKAQGILTFAGSGNNLSVACINPNQICLFYNFDFIVLASRNNLRRLI